MKNIRRERLGQLLNERFDGRQADFAAHVGIAANLVSRYITGNKGIGEDMARKIEGACRLAPHWMDGTGNHANTEPGPDLRGTVPVISWVRAGQWDEAVDPYGPGEAEEWLHYPKKNGERIFALRVTGDSMTSSTGRSYPNGCVIFVDPEHRTPANGARIVAKLEGTNEVVFKVFMQDAGRTWLRALNRDYEPIRDAFKVIGTVVGTWVPE